MRIRTSVVMVAFTFALAASSRAELRLHGLFTDHMVLQRDRELPVWGWADPGETVTVQFAGQTKTATVGADGRWTIRLDPMPASAEPRSLTVSSDPQSEITNLKCEDVLVGDVWLASGQSNMYWPVERADHARAEIAAADHPGIRLFQAPLAAAAHPRDDTAGQWAVCSPESVPGFSAVAYYFGRELHKALDIPVGLIHASVRGTVIEVWMSSNALAVAQDVTPVPREWATSLSKWALGLYPDPMTDAYAYSQDIQRGLAEYMDRWEAMRKEGAKDPRAAMDHEYIDGVDQRLKMLRIFKNNMPSSFFNGMIHPLTRYRIRGAIWYQGESNALRKDVESDRYRKLLTAMVEDWRNVWAEGDFPFLVVGLANFKPRPDAPGDSGFACIREAQIAVRPQLPHVGFVNTIDLGEAKNVHFPNKQDVGKRLALVAEAMVYERPVVYSGPVFRSMERTPAGILIQFDYAEDGLVTTDDTAVKGFAVAGADKAWHWADATISNESVRVTCEAVTDPVAVRYGWADNPEVNLYNTAGLPAVPFRTDDWPMGK